MPSTINLAEEALTLAGEGLAVFPCNADKTPRTPNGFKDATTDRALVLAWDEVKAWDGGMIGAEVPWGVVVIDIDPRNGGEETLHPFPALPPTYEVTTGSGGRHLYYSVDPSVELRGTFGSGVDIKRHGKGYVIVPPSKGYSVERESALTPLPEWLLEALRVPERSEAEYAAHEPKFFEWQDGTAYGERALALELEALLASGAGGRNDALNRASFALAQLVAGGELSGERVMTRLEQAAEDLGLTERETAKTIASGWEAGLAEPRQAPPRTDAAAPASPFADLSERVAIRDTGEGEDSMWLRWTEDADPISFLLYPIIPERAYIWVYGPAAASKSMVFCALGAEGSHLGIRTTVYSLENPKSIDHDRLRRLNPDPANFRLTNEPLDFNDPAQVEALIERELAWETQLLVIDTYSHATGDRAEDGNAKAIQFARVVRHIMHEVGCSVVVLDHTGYTHDEPRDASAKRQQVDVCVLMAQADEGWKPGRPAQFRMENRKAARFGNPFELAGEIQGARHEPLTLAWHGEEPKWQVAL